MTISKIGSDNPLLRQALTSACQAKWLSKSAYQGAVKAQTKGLHNVATTPAMPSKNASGVQLPVNPRPAPIAIATTPIEPAPFPHCGTSEGLGDINPTKSSAAKSDTVVSNLVPENVAPGTPDPAPLTADVAHDPLTLDGFQKAWGKAGSSYDLNLDGTVNMDDLLQFLASQPAPNAASPSVPGAPNDSIVETSPKVDEVAANPTTMPGAPADVQTTPGTPVAADVAPDAHASSVPSIVSNTGPTPALTIDGLLAAWSQGPSTSASPSMYDLNVDGTVNMDDLLQLLNQITPGASGNARLANDQSAITKGGAGSADGVAKTMDTHGHQKRLNTLVGSLIDRLNQAGFENQPPTNIRELVSSMNLSPSQTNSALRQLRDRYPQGLGVNVTA